MCWTEPYQLYDCQCFDVRLQNQDKLVPSDESTSRNMPDWQRCSRLHPQIWYGVTTLQLFLYLYDIHTFVEEAVSYTRARKWVPILNQDDLYIGTYGQNVLQGLSDEEAAYLHVYSLLKLLNSPQGDVEDREGRACLLYQGLLDSQKRELPISHFGQLLLKVSPLPEDLKIICQRKTAFLTEDESDGCPLWLSRCPVHALPQSTVSSPTN